MKIHIPAYEPSLECTERLRHGEIDIDLGEDVVEVVRCKDCKHSTEKQGFENRIWNDDCVMCDHIAPSDRIPMNKNDFCSYGERKDKV